MVHSSSRVQAALQRGTRVVLQGSVVSRHADQWGKKDADRSRVPADPVLAFAVGLDALMRSGWRKEGDRV